VQQVGLMDDLADLSQPHTQHHDAAGPTAAAAGAGAGMADGGGGGSSGSFGGDGVGGRAVSWQEVLPVLGSPQVDQLMGRMAQVTEVGVVGGERGAAHWCGVCEEGKGQRQGATIAVQR